MQYALSTILGMTIGGGLMYYFMQKLHRASSEEEKLQELRNDVRNAKDRILELETKGRELYDRFKSKETEHAIIAKERDALMARVSKFEAEAARQEKQHQDLASKLEGAKEALEDERKRIRREDEERQKRQEEDRDRMWAEHEHTVISKLSDLCKQPQFGFSFYDNAHLPQSFHGKLKPDCLVEFLGQYVIFDAKVSKASNLQVYIAEQVKKTAQKVKGEAQIYPTIYLVVPAIAVQELKKTAFYEEGFSFFVVSTEALAPILASLKKIESYEFAQGMDPQERENIVDLVAQFDFHISSRNAVDFLLMQHGMETLAKTEQIDPELAREAAVKKAKMRSLALSSAEHKQLAASPDLLREKMQAFVQPRAKISQQDLDDLRK